MQTDNADNADNADADEHTRSQDFGCTYIQSYVLQRATPAIKGRYESVKFNVVYHTIADYNYILIYKIMWNAMANYWTIQVMFLNDWTIHGPVLSAFI